MENGDTENVNLECELKTMLKQKFESTESSPPSLPKKSTLRRNIEIEQSDAEEEDFNAFAMDDYVPESSMIKDISARKRSQQMMKKMVSFSGSEVDSETETDDILEEDSDIQKHSIAIRDHANYIRAESVDHNGRAYPPDMPFDGPDQVPYYATESWNENCYEPPSHTPPPLPVPHSDRKVYVSVGVDEPSGHRVLQNPYPTVPIGRKKKDRKIKQVQIDKTSKNIESLVRPDEVTRYFTDLNDSKTSMRSQPDVMQKSSMANLVEGVNLLPPMNQDAVEAIYLARKHDLDTELEENGFHAEHEMPDRDAYADSFMQSEKQNQIHFSDPMMAAMNRIAETPMEGTDFQLPPDGERKVLSEENNEIYRTESGKRAANFDFPQIPIGRRGLKKQKKGDFNDEFNLRSATASNVLSLVPVSERENLTLGVGTFHDDYQIEIDKANKEKEVDSKKIKSKLGPILNLDDIGFERSMIIGPGETKLIESVDPVQNDLAPVEIGDRRVSTTTGETGDKIKEKLKELMEASGQKQAEIEQLKSNTLKAEGVGSSTKISIDTKKDIVERIPIEKKRRKNSEKKEFTIEENILKDEKDEKIIEVFSPENIKNFGKKDKPPKEPGFDEVFSPFSSIPPVNYEGVPLNQDAMVNTLNSLGLQNMVDSITNHPSNHEPSHMGIIDPSRNLNEQLDKIGVEGDLNDLELFPLAMGPIAEIEILRTDFNGNIEEVKTMSLKREEKPPMEQNDDDDDLSAEKSSRLESPEVVKGEDSADSNKSLDRNGVPVPPPRSAIGSQVAIASQVGGSQVGPKVPARTYLAQVPENLQGKTAWEDPDKSININVPETAHIKMEIEELEFDGNACLPRGIPGRVAKLLW